MPLKYPPPINITQTIELIFNKYLCCLIFFLFIFGGVVATFGQVKIKERVEIKTNGIMLDVSSTQHYTPCGPFINSNDYNNPWQVVWAGAAYRFDVGEQVFNYQANYNKKGGYKIDSTKFYNWEIIEGRNLCVLREYDRENKPDIKIINISKLLNISGKELVSKGTEYMLIQGVPTRMGHNKYQINFEKLGNVTIRITDLSTGEIINYHTKIVDIKYKYKYTGALTLPHGEESQNIDIR